jgi:predicted NBD/HSP70 family sugar kinase
MTYILFDIGGTHMRIAASDGDVVGDVRTEATPQDPDAAAMLLAACVRDIAADATIEGIAGGLPGIIAPDGFVHAPSPNLPQWGGYDFARSLREDFCERIVVRNDADVAGLGEAVYGAGINDTIIAYMNIGTGVGGGRIVHKEIDRAAFGFEPGRHIIDAAQGTTLEEAVGGRAVGERYRMHPRELPHEVWEDLTPILAVGIHNTIMYWSPERIVFGGSMMSDEAGFRVEDIVRCLRQMSNALSTLPEMCATELGGHAALWGALALLREQVA